MTPSVSVVMPVYNGERFVAEAVRSILNQTLTDFELIVVDDASTDSTPAILHELAAADRRVRLHRLARNSGAVGARNAGMDRASADLIAAIDADDVSLPERLASQAAFLHGHPDVDLVGSYVQIIDEHGREGPIRRGPTTPGLTAWSFLFLNAMRHSTAMMRRHVHEALGGYGEGFLGGCEDFDFFSRGSRRGGIANVPEVLVRYRVWSGNMTTGQWEGQESSANRIVSESVTYYTGVSCDVRTAQALRGLATDRYPSDESDIERLADLLPVLCDGFLAKSPVAEPEHADVRQDAAIKLWLLAALAAPRSPALAAKIAATATRMQPTSLIGFLRKAANRVAANSP
jgi:glycosyltransferase involved in cell wall biosynthesis